MIKLRYVGAVADNSGYADAARNYIASLLSTGEVDLTVKTASFEHQKTSHGALADKIQTLIDKNVNYNIQIVHLTPENYPAFRDPKAYNIAYTVWETDRLPDNWVDLCNMMDEIWVPSEYNIEIFKRSGVVKPIIKIPHAIVKPAVPSSSQHIKMSINDDDYIFYSIFQWIVRKNPVGLLEAYLTEFKPEEHVCLCLKTYRLDSSPKEQDIIKKDIANIKASLNLRAYPPILFFGNLFPVEMMDAFYSKGHCFISPHCSEGFGITPANAMLYGKPTIATRYSGNLDVMNDTNSYLIDYQMSPVSKMLFSNYHGLMNWAQPDISHLKQLMREVYTNREQAAARAALGKMEIENNYNYEKIGQLMLNRLKQILSDKR